MNYDEYKNSNLSMKDLSNEDVQELIIDIEKRIKIKQKELEIINDKIRKIKFKIDNWKN